MLAFSSGECRGQRGEAELREQKAGRKCLHFHPGNAAASEAKPSCVSKRPGENAMRAKDGIGKENQ